MVTDKQGVIIMEVYTQWDQETGTATQRSEIIFERFEWAALAFYGIFWELTAFITWGIRRL
jgi:hypothetical protein